MVINNNPYVMLCLADPLYDYMVNQDFTVTRRDSIDQVLQSPAKQGIRAFVIGEKALPDVSDKVLIEEIVNRCREHLPLVDIIIWSPSSSREMIRVALNCGARDVLLTHSPEHCTREIKQIIESQQLLPRTTQENNPKDTSPTFEGIFAKSTIMWDLFETASQVAATDATVLILGETGTGKELMARAIHKISKRSGRFVPLNCGAINESLVDSELFGHEKGAFTGAQSSKKGLFSHADKGTLFLDEIGNVPLTAQYHLLRTLQEGTIRPVGSNYESPVDARVIAATSNDLSQDVAKGTFREDLLYRLDVIRLEIPPLRNRQDDLIYLFAHFSKKISEDYNVSRPDLTDDFLDALTDYPWPGNVRELENFSERLILTQTGQRLSAKDFKELITPKYHNAQPQVNNPQVHSTDRDSQSLQETLKINLELPLTENIDQVTDIIEKEYLQQCLKENKGLIEKTAIKSGISRRTLLRKLTKYNIDKMKFR